MKLFIKNMVCERCMRVVKEELEKLGAQILSIKLGEATILENKSITKTQIETALSNAGFELLADQSAKLVEKTKALIIELVQSGQIRNLKSTQSNYLSKEIGKDYSTLSGLFSSVEGITLERFIILQKIERVKELLYYGELSLKEIAFELGYKELPHLSHQFKQVTGFTPSAFKQLKENINRKPLDQVSS